ncbi:MAG: hypothetical protein DRI79_14025 [Chloroflexi bacterium]|nr:MAG: hypothetical protein DRI80_06660 [Chloroflexota bacterium]RLC83312.1 MAG: hypothetical protein DRI79_14025 [Chloroflexota bacterium]
MSKTVTIPIELSVEQLVQAIHQLSAARQREVLEALEDLFFGLLIAETEEDEMLSREAAIAYVERMEAQGTA